jgi:hypothetical protein
MTKERKNAAVVMDYPTRDGRAEYGFSIEFQPDGSWRIYIVIQPPRRNCENNSKFPYLVAYDERRPYVNWPAKIDNLSDAKKVAQLWAETSRQRA